MTVVLGFQTLKLNDYSSSSTFSIRIHGLPLFSFSFIILSRLNIDRTIIGIHSMIDDISIYKINYLNAPQKINLFFKILIIV